MANKPVNELRKGVIKASIWKNETEKGVFYNTTLEKLYRTGKEWKSSRSFSRDQLLVVSNLAQEANAWIYEQAKRDRANRSDNQAEHANDSAA